jgi:hypothetical protein
MAQSARKRAGGTRAFVLCQPGQLAGPGGTRPAFMATLEQHDGFKLAIATLLEMTPHGLELSDAVQIPVPRGAELLRGRAGERRSRVG